MEIFSEEPIKGKTYIADKWIYYDIPTKFSYEMWDKFLIILEEENYKILAMSKGKDWVRGQFLISPKGMDNIRKYSASKKNED